MSNIVTGLCLALLIDGSGSIPKDDIFPMMVEAHANVLETEMVHRQITTEGMAISVIMIESTPRIIIDWKIIQSDEKIRSITRDIRNISPLDIMQWTAIGDSINTAIDTLESSNINCDRTIIDVSTDGVNTDGTSPEVARERAEALGITINAVTTETDSEAPTRAADAARDGIITHDGFVLGATNWNDWFIAIRRKMIMEITGIY